MTQAFFVTGTDTEVGKTFVSCALMQALRQAGQTVIGYKPIAAGAELSHHGLLNDDALLLQQNGSLPLPYEAVNPIVFAPPIAPHIAAAQAQQTINMQVVEQGYQNLLEQGADTLLVEGAGGWHLPLGNGQNLSDWVAQAQLPVIMVVGMKLGCLNHALLTAESITRAGLKLVSWVANSPGVEQGFLAENIAHLEQVIDAPLLGKIPAMNGAQSEFSDVMAAAKQAADNLNIAPLQAIK
ncbi:dethiobiotin synthase [Motilimonas eburnea]|uniref:dethiobiotin synthase n=1 Tax=Motilimonas eburnea TaxID=1737488 RepID=UPI001E335039|nr:dethiobiotin synthase [Motilimonas eburnea]MCE2570061.1 dethiobiotin synthase [Motilimonas eburnea]